MKIFALLVLFSAVVGICYWAVSLRSVSSPFPDVASPSATYRIERFGGTYVVTYYRGMRERQLLVGSSAVDLALYIGKPVRLRATIPLIPRTNIFRGTNTQCIVASCHPIADKPDEAGPVIDIERVYPMSYGE